MESHKEPSRDVTVSKPPLGSKVAAGAVEGGAKEVAMTILSQMGGVGRIQAMTGAKNFAYFDEKGVKGVSFNFPNRGNKPNFVKITLDEGTDTYTVEFGKKKPISWKRMEKIAEAGRDPKAEDFYTKLSEHTGVYWDMLKELFEKNTGLYLSFSKALVIDMAKARTKGAKDIKQRKKRGHWKYRDPITGKDVWIPYKAKNVQKVELGFTPKVKPASERKWNEPDWLD